jgi:hypothetical protein
MALHEDIVEALRKDSGPVAVVKLIDAAKAADDGPAVEAIERYLKAAYLDPAIAAETARIAESTARKERLEQTRTGRVVEDPRLGEGGAKQ